MPPKRTATKMTKEKAIPMEIDEVPQRAVKRGKAAVKDEAPDLHPDTNNNNESAAKKIKRTMEPKHDRGIGKALICGTNDVGQLGFKAMRRKHPALVPFLEENNLQVQEVAAGGMHTIVLSKDGHVYCFGCNDDLALGRVTEDEDDNFIPTIVKLPGTVVQISAGDSHSAALTDDGAVYAWGQFRDQNGSIGLTTEIATAQPVPQCLSRDLASKITKIASGAHHLVMLGVDGVVYTCGSGEQGQLGRVFTPAMTRSTRSRPNVPQNAREYWLTPAPIKLRSRIKFVDVFTGSFSTYIKSAKNGEIYVCGLNNFNQLGIRRPGNEEEEDLVVSTITKSPGFIGKQWKEIAAGEHHCVALSVDGQVYSLGRQEDGRLGLGPGVEEVTVPTLIPSLADYKCVHVACGLAQGYVVTDTGRLFSWGFGENCQLGNGADVDSIVPTECNGSEVLKLNNFDIIYASGGGQHAAFIGISKTATAAIPPPADNVKNAKAKTVTKLKVTKAKK